MPSASSTNLRRCGAMAGCFGLPSVAMLLVPETTSLLYSPFASAIARFAIVAAITFEILGPTASQGASRRVCIGVALATSALLLLVAGERMSIVTWLSQHELNGGASFCGDAQLSEPVWLLGVITAQCLVAGIVAWPRRLFLLGSLSGVVTLFLAVVETDGLIRSGCG